MSTTPPSPLSVSVNDDEDANNINNKNDNENSAASKNATTEVEEEENEFYFYFILHAYNSVIPSIVHSPYQSHGGYLWRLVVYPRDCANGISAALECGGPTVMKKQWSISVRHNLVLVHPSKWESFLGITDVHAPDQLSRRLYENNENGGSQGAQDDKPAANGSQGAQGEAKPADNGCGSQGAQGEEKKRKTIIPEDIAPYDLHVTKTHTFSSTDYSLWDDEDEFAPYAILQPGMFTDDDFNLVVKAHVILHDFYNSVPLDEAHAASTVGENDHNDNTVLLEEVPENAFDYLDPKNELVQNLNARKQLIDEVLNLDRKLLEVNQDVAKKALEKEMRAIGDTLHSIDQPKDVIQKLMAAEEKHKNAGKKKNKKKFTPKKAITSCFSHPSNSSDSHSIPSIPRICVPGDI